MIKIIINDFVTQSSCTKSEWSNDHHSQCRRVPTDSTDTAVAIFNLRNSKPSRVLRMILDVN